MNELNLAEEEISKGSNVTPTENSVKKFFARIGSVIYSPDTAFIGSVGKWEWLAAIMITVFMSIGVKELQEPYLAPMVMDAAMSGLEANREQIPAEQYAELEQSIEEDVRGQFSFTPKRVSIEVLASIIFTLIIAGCGMVAGNFFFGSKASFRQALTIVAFVGFIGIIGDLARAALMHSNETGYVYLGLGLLKPVDDGSFLHYFLRIQGFSTWWVITVMAVGFGTIFAKPAMKFGYYFGGLWILIAALIAGANKVLGGVIVF